MEHFPAESTTVHHQDFEIEDVDLKDLDLIATTQEHQQPQEEDALMSVAASGIQDKEEEEELSMTDFFDAEDLLNDETIGTCCKRRASIDIALQLWSSSMLTPESEGDEHEGKSETCAPPPKKRAKIPASSSLHKSITSDRCGGCENEGSRYCNEGSFDQRRYNELLLKLSESMKRSGQSRAEMMRLRKQQHGGNGDNSLLPSSGQPSADESSSFHRSSSSSTPVLPSSSPMSHSLPPQPQQIPSLSVVMGLPGFLSGSQSTLTSGLEDSRRRLATYMSQMSSRFD